MDLELVAKLLQSIRRAWLDCRGGIHCQSPIHKHVDWYPSNQNTSVRYHPIWLKGKAPIPLEKESAAWPLNDGDWRVVWSCLWSQSACTTKTNWILIAIAFWIWISIMKLCLLVIHLNKHTFWTIKGVVDIQILYLVWTANTFLFNKSLHFDQS